MCTEAFMEDTTYRVLMDVWYDDTFTFLSVNFDDYYLRHSGDNLRMKIEEFQDSDDFKGDATYISELEFL